MIKEIVKGVWAFCSYLFVPQLRTKPKGGGTKERGITQRENRRGR